MTRKSPLALRQADYVQRQLQILYPTLSIELLPITTSGDHRADNGKLASGGGKGLFVKELEWALLNGQADMAVHSMKDVPMTFPDGLTLAVICEREDPRDAFISPLTPTLATLPAGARVGTSSLRRKIQLLALHPAVTVVRLHGNVGTRLHKLAQGECHALILAAAGLIRLQRTECITHYLPIESFLPAIGQGALGIECRADDSKLQRLLAPLNHWPSYCCVMAERAMGRHLAADCTTPIAAYATCQPPQIQLQGLVGSADASVLLKASLTGPMAASEQLGRRLAEKLLAQGADGLLLASS